MKFIKYTALTLLVLFVAFMALGAFVSPSSSTQADSRQEACTRMWQDARPGDEKRTARQMCDKLGVRP